MYRTRKILKWTGRLRLPPFPPPSKLKPHWDWGVLVTDTSSLSLYLSRSRSTYRYLPHRTTQKQQQWGLRLVHGVWRLYSEARWVDSWVGERGGTFDWRRGDVGHARQANRRLLKGDRPLCSLYFLVIRFFAWTLSHVIFLSRSFFPHFVFVCYGGWCLVSQTCFISVM